MTDSNKDTGIAKNINYDWYKDSEIRYLGYANEVGEAFRNVVPPIVVAGSYGISVAYALGDTLDKFLSNDMSIKYAADTLIWQGLASVAIPGFTINRICWLTNKLTGNMKYGKFITSAVGLCSIPFIIHPIDSLVHYGMNNTLRPIFNIPKKE